MDTFHGLKWKGIVSIYNGFRKRNYSVDCDRALLLKRIRDEHPWQDRDRFASEAAFLKFTNMSWEQIVTDHLKENVTETDNAIRVLEKYGEDKYRKFGRDALLRLMHRVPDENKQVKVIRVMTDRSRALGRAISTATVATIIDEVVPETRRNYRNEDIAILKQEILQLRTYMEGCARCRKLARRTPTHA